MNNLFLLVRFVIRERVINPSEQFILLWKL